MTSTGTTSMDLRGANVFNLDDIISSAKGTDVGKLRAVLLARGDREANYHDITDDVDYYNEHIANSVIMNIQAEFDLFFNNLITEINSILEEAQGNYATANPDVFADPSDYIMFTQADETARVQYDIGSIKAGQNELGFTIANTKVNDLLVQDPSLLCLRDKEGNEDQITTEALKAAFTTSKYTVNPNVTTRQSILTYYNAIVTQVANSGQMYNNLVDNQQLTVNEITSAREQVHGVSQDEELQYMIQFQNAYNASSRYINVIAELLEHIINTLGR